MSAAATSGDGGGRRRGNQDGTVVEEGEARMDSWFPSNGDRKRAKVGDGGGGDGDLNNGKEEAKPSAAVEERVEMVKEMVGVLKGIDSSLRSRTNAKGSDRLPTMDEQRLLNLILGHVDSCILLHHTTIPHHHHDQNNNKSKRMLMLPCASRLVERRMYEVRCRIIDGITKPLEQLRRNITGFDPEKERPKGKELVRYYFNLGHPRSPVPLDISRGLLNNNSPFLAHLVDILHSLLVLAQRRDLAPPGHEGDEIGCYKQIRTQLCSTLLYAQAIDRLMVTGMESPLVSRCYPYHIDAGDHNAPTFFSFGHMFSRCFDLMHVSWNLLHDCQNRLSQLMSNHNQQQQQQPQGEASPAVIVVGDRLLRWQQPDQEMDDPTTIVMKSRLECLNIIIAKLERILSSTSKGKDLTEREIHLYAHIAEHVRASLWLSNVWPSTEDGNEICMVNVAGIKEVAPITADDGDGSFTREEYLKDIMSYVRAFKPIFSAEALTFIEKEAYHKIWILLGADFPWCSKLKPMGTQGGRKEEPPAWLREGLSAMFERIIEFLGEVEKQETSMLALVLGALVPEEAARLEAAPLRCAFELSAPSKVKLEEFFRCDSAGRMEFLDRLLVVLDEMSGSTTDVICKLYTAVWDFEGELSIGEDYTILEREVINAGNIIGCENY